MEAEPILMGGLEVKSGITVPKRFSMLLWGPAKGGKTTLASTAPGKKLWINFDPDGTASLYGRDDVMVADFSAEKPHVIMPKLLNEDPVSLADTLRKHPEIESVVLDSTTTLAALAQKYACFAKNLKQEEPGQRGYSVKNNFLMQVITNVLRICQECGRNIILIAHEGAPNMDDEGHIVSISIALGGSLVTNLSALPSEVWHVSDVDGKRRVAVRSCRQRSPMGTRMFDASGEPEFMWRYDPITRKGEGIAEWFKAWADRGGKIPLPK